MTQLIPDVSNYQGVVDWGAVVASGRVGGICKASEGMGYVDPTFNRNWTTLGQMNVVRGAYHFARPSTSAGAAQARYFLKAVGATKPTDLLILDIEVGDGELSGWALEFLYMIKAATLGRPMLYSYAPFIRVHLHDQRLATFPLWLAAYQSKPPACPPPWASFSMWQHADNADIPGIKGPCDESVLYESISPVKVAPVFDPPLQIVDFLDNPAGPGGWGLNPDGGIHALGGCPYRGPDQQPFGHDYWGNRKAAKLEANGQGYTVVATDGARYDYP